MGNLPEIKKQNGIDTLFVHGEPFIILGGEIHNSSASSLDYMEDKVWPNLKGLHMNTVILPIYWELIEAEEGKYDFTLLNGLIAQARRNQMHLILLWFGLWKNAESMYVPGWMKQDTEKYYRARKVSGETIPTISPLCQAAVEKDAKALAQVMAHLRVMDELENTVIAIQVENEIGLMGTDRDYSAEGIFQFTQKVPHEVEEEFAVNGSWKECFGNDAGEYFMAYHFAKTVEFITRAAKKEYNLPCYANAWLKQYPWYLGSYPCGGPVASMHRMWKRIAPSLFCLAPDIYVPYVAQVMEEYTKNGNPLLIPEVRKDAVSSSYALYAFGKYHALGYSPFAIEELAMDPSTIQKPPLEVMIALNIDPSAFEIDGSKEYLAGVYRLMEQIKPLYFQYRGTPQLQSYVKQSETDYGVLFPFKQYDFQIGYAPKQPCKPVAAGMIYEVSDNSFYLIGMMSNIRIHPKYGENSKVDILRLEEGEFENGTWKCNRVLNGDEKMSLNLGDKLSCYYLELYKF